MIQKRQSPGSIEVVDLSMNPPKRLKVHSNINNNGPCIIDLENTKVNFKNDNLFFQTNKLCLYA
jgi:hypothetical protein